MNPSSYHSHQASASSVIIWFRIRFIRLLFFFFRKYIKKVLNDTFSPFLKEREKKNNISNPV